MNQAPPSRPTLRYHGGKWMLAPWINGHFPEHRIYTEVYGGGASVLMRKTRSYAEVYNDLDGEVVNVFRVIQNHRSELERLLRATPFAREEYALAFEETDNDVERARRTIMRSFMGFGSNSIRRCIRSGFRANSNRNGTTAGHDWANYPDALRAMEHRLQGVVIENRPALQVLHAQDSPETLHYVDPPYVHSTRSATAGKGYEHEMTDQQHRELAEAVHGLKGMVVLSGYASDLYDGLYSDWKRETRRAFADGTRERLEVLWLSPAACRRDLRLWGGAA